MKFIVDLFGDLMNGWRAHISYVLKIFHQHLSPLPLRVPDLVLTVRAGTMLWCSQPAF